MTNYYYLNLLSKKNPYSPPPHFQLDENPCLLNACPLHYKTASSHLNIFLGGGGGSHAHVRLPAPHHKNYETGQELERRKYLASVQFVSFIQNAKKKKKSPKKVLSYLEKQRSPPPIQARLNPLREGERNDLRFLWQIFLLPLLPFSFRRAVTKLLWPTLPPSTHPNTPTHTHTLPFPTSFPRSPLTPLLISLPPSFHCDVVMPPPPVFWRSLILWHTRDWHLEEEKFWRLVTFPHRQMHLVCMGKRISCLNSFKKK